MRLPSGDQAGGQSLRTNSLGDRRVGLAPSASIRYRAGIVIYRRLVEQAGAIRGGQDVIQLLSD